MALIKCPECGKEISDKALACPDVLQANGTKVTKAMTRLQTKSLNVVGTADVKVLGAMGIVKSVE